MVKVKESVVDDDLADLIRSSKMVICTQSQYGLLLKKYLEVGFCGSLICGDIPNEYRELMKDEVIEITNQMSDSEILITIRDALANWSELSLVHRSNSSEGG